MRGSGGIFYFPAIQPLPAGIFGTGGFAGIGFAGIPTRAGLDNPYRHQDYNESFESFRGFR
jgi:hypothetical protein